MATPHRDGHSQLRLAINRSSLEQRAKSEEVATVAGPFLAADERLTKMSTTPAASRSSAARMTRHRERRRQGTHCVTVEVSQSERDALVVRGYLSEEDRDSGTAIKKAIEGILSDLVFELLSETAERTRARA